MKNKRENWENEEWERRLRKGGISEKTKKMKNKREKKKMKNKRKNWENEE